MGDEERFLRYQSLILLYTIDDKEYVLKNIKTKKVFKVSEDEYKKILDKGENIEYDIYTTWDDEDN